jgi:hypothetical protein
MSALEPNSGGLGRPKDRMARAGRPRSNQPLLPFDGKTR